MFHLSVNTNRGTKVNDFICSHDECLIGKDDTCYVTLHGWKVSKQHALIIRRNDGLYVKHLGGSFSTYVNGEKIEEYGPLVEKDEISIHSYKINIKDVASANSAAQTKSKKEIEIPESTQSPSMQNDKASLRERPIFRQEGTAGEDISADVVSSHSEVADSKRADEKLARLWQRKIHDELIKKMDLRRINVNEMSDNELREITQKLINEILREGVTLPSGLDKSEISQRVLAEAIGLGPLEQLIAQDDISEIMVNSAEEIFYEKGGRLSKSDITFSDDRAVIYAIERIVAPLGRRIDESSPMVDARLRDGSRVNAIIPPLALKGPCITIRKFMKDKLEASHLVGFGTATNAMMNFLEMAVTHKQNIVISGGTGSGKTTLLNVMSNFIPESERIVTVEDSAELKLYQPNLVALEARPENQEGKGSVSIRELVKNCLRMRPDRIVVGECRGGEALDMLQAMNTGHDGSLTTAHANTVHDCVSRIEVMVMMSGMDLPSIAIREQISSAVGLIVQQTRFSCGSRKITSISEVSGVDAGRVQLGEIFKFKQSGYDAEGRVEGEFIATGLIPGFYENLRERGIPVDMSIFQKDEVLK